ncbi:hypothetical protein OE88DRAFT_1712786 [Heliocybe sulcata]|uniref:Methyltransferase domain-containing protein n=1 Tax=Heliocybe sulcata TaxID=5364 RepID=A0A5C3N1C6_9AGAM|nr:hypothetical protein OE88DRAFT_1712786 [Heliocybe sulcata]
MSDLESESAFFKSQTGIIDDDELKQHILSVWEKAYKVHLYPCTRRFASAKLKISRLPSYPHFLQLGKDRDAAIFLDIGCCFGNDVRKAVADGYPVDKVIASDLRSEFWDLGHELFRSTPETFSVPFIQGDVFDSAFLARAQISYAPSSNRAPVLRSLTTLTPLIGHISAIHASAFFHLFNEEQQLELARRMASLLSPEPGSIIFGSHVGQPHKSVRTSRRTTNGRDIFCHSDQSWRDLWNGQVFQKGKVQVDSQLIRVGRPDFSQTEEAYLLVWSVIRL